MNTTSFVEHLMLEILDSVYLLLQTNLPIMNRRLEKYEKGKDTEAKGINRNFENLVRDAVYQVLAKLKIKYASGILPQLSDVSIETDEFILQVDAKGCHVKDGDFTKKPKGFKGHCGIAQTSLTTTKTNKKGIVKEWKGLQQSTIDEKPVYTLIAFMRWGYSDKYYIESCGVVNLPHTNNDILSQGGKSAHEMRWIVTNSDLYQIRQFACE